MKILILFKRIVRRLFIRENEGVENINKWAQERIKTPDGKWTDDTMFCILYLMENRAPYTWRYDATNYNETEYKRLIEIACEYIIETKSIKNARELEERIEEDFEDPEISTDIKKKMLFSNEKWPRAC